MQHSSRKKHKKQRTAVTDLQYDGDVDSDEHLVIEDGGDPVMDDDVLSDLDSADFQSSEEAKEQTEEVGADAEEVHSSSSSSSSSASSSSSSSSSRQGRGGGKQHWRSHKWGSFQLVFRPTSKLHDKPQWEATCHAHKPTSTASGTTKSFCRKTLTVVGGDDASAIQHTLQLAYAWCCHCVDYENKAEHQKLNPRLARYAPLVGSLDMLVAARPSSEVIDRVRARS